MTSRLQMKPDGTWYESYGLRKMNLAMYRIVETDNHAGDYPDEKFVTLPLLLESQAERIAGSINEILCVDDRSDRYWKVVDQDYQLIPGFQP